MKVEIAPAWDDLGEVELLFSEYTRMLAEEDGSIQGYLTLQGYEEELRHLEDKYGPPGGRLYLARCDGAPAGCVGLRKMDDRRCELKRLYVRPQFRGRHVGSLLVGQAIDDARTLGYARMLLDTLPFLQGAIYLYRRLGFYEIPRYNDSPMDTSIYMQLDL